MEVVVIVKNHKPSEVSEEDISEVDVLEEDKPAEVDSKEVDVPNLYNIPLSALRHVTLLCIGNRLNDEKLFQTLDKTKKSYHRDWRGLVDLLGLPRPGQAEDKAGQVLRSWEKKTEGATIGALLNVLETIERWDIVDDYYNQMYSDAGDFERRKKTGEIISYNDEEPLDLLIVNKVFTNDDKKRFLNREPLLKYNALIIYAAAIYDTQIAKEMQKKLTETGNNEAERHVCLKSDILPGLMERNVIFKLIAERCSYVIVIITPNYGLESPENQFIVNFARSINQKRRAIIPCIYGGRHVPLPKELNFLAKLDHSMEKKSMTGYGFWDRLKISINTNNADTSDEESFKYSKLQMINRIPTANLDEDMKERELRQDDGAKLMEIVEREGETYHLKQKKEVLNGISESAPSLKPESKKQTRIQKLKNIFKNKKPKKGH